MAAEDDNPYAAPHGQLGAAVGEERSPDRPYRAAVRRNLVAQTIVLLLASLVLDMGQLLRLCTVAAVAYWAGVAVIVCRRPRSPTRSDLAFVGWGFWLLLILTRIITPVVWRLTGQV